MAYTAADLEMAHRHVAEGERHIVQQEELITRLRERGLPTQAADELLSTYNSLLVEHRQHRDAIALQLSRPE
jgi:hypothetical protein